MRWIKRAGLFALYLAPDGGWGMVATENGRQERRMSCRMKYIYSDLHSIRMIVVPECLSRCRSCIACKPRLPPSFDSEQSHVSTDSG
ncbi:hypothetical protein EV363DRAFT_1361928 [Boletus edulis]|uniref:Secreted protein n=1 Tax=Boletus edulis BED1 TaxID=1328754 RepID=A0AAD4B9N1_BOLED|nr:hypothetical protein EV363DRAFT_1361928 [Boletus edulis]KAF8414465.1 hypothetical protein L210DRAFT_3592627 [Boletus edulis BED1]